MRRLRVTVTRLRAGQLMDNNSPVDDWSQPDRHPVRGALVQPAGTAEEQERRDSSTTRYQLQFMPDPEVTERDGFPDIQAGDRIELPGDDRQWRIIGEPLIQPSLTGIGYLYFEISLTEG